MSLTSPDEAPTKVLVGLDRVPEGEWAGQKVALLTNQAAVGQDRLTGLERFRRGDFGADLVRVFAPEHGIDLSVGPGEEVPSSPGRVPIISLYPPGKVRWRPELLEGVDNLVCDLPDCGARYFSHLHTFLRLAEQVTAVEVKVTVLDRPNPIGGIDIQGNMLLPEWISPIGAHPLPMRHGMTFGELTTMVNQERGLGISLQVIPCAGWDRGAIAPASGSLPVPLSPNLRLGESLWLYPGTCLFEGTNLSEGRGTTAPFCFIGAPWVDSRSIVDALREPMEALFGIGLESASFRPAGSKYCGQDCHGFRLSPADPPKPDPCRAVVMLICELAAHHADCLTFEESFFDRLGGTDELRKGIQSGMTWEELTRTWDSAADEFRSRRNPFLLY